MHTACVSSSEVSAQPPSVDRAPFPCRQAPPPVGRPPHCRQTTPPRRNMGAGSQTGSDIIHILPCGQTNTCENITLSQTSFAGGKYYQVVPTKYVKWYLCFS